LYTTSGWRNGDAVREIYPIKPCNMLTVSSTLVQGGTDTSEGRAALSAGIPMARFCQPEDIGNAACYLASDEARFLTGVCLDVDGGRSLN
jgi:3-oxoacyl-[acyl-carrier protein] reductase